MMYAATTGASSGENLLQFLTDGEPLESVYAAASSGRESLASLLTAAITKGTLEVDALEDLEEDEVEVNETSRPPVYCARPS